MSPDLNSLPLSSSSASRIPSRPISDTTPPQSAAPLMSDPQSSHNAPRTGSSSSEHRRSAASISLNPHDQNAAGAEQPPPSDHRSSMSHVFRTASPSSALGNSPIMTGDPHHHRAPSLGELHQELEQEQEAQVNRLLQMIRSQQTQLQQLQQHQQPSSHHQHQSGTAIDDSTPSSERSVAFPPIPPMPPAGSRTSISQLPSSLSSRRPSRPSSQAPSPNLRPRGSVESSRGPDGLEGIGGINDSPAQRSSRDESSFYQTEAAMLSRENQMLRQRIRDLERQIGELTTSPSTAQSVTATEAAETADRHATAGVGSAGESTGTDKT